MQAIVDGKKWRLRFEHFVPETKGLSKSKTKKLRPFTVCSIERWDETPLGSGEKVVGWRPVAFDKTKCGPQDAFNKESGRQFSMVYALRQETVPKPVKSALIQAYMRSAPNGRMLCYDLFLRGYENFFDAVFREDKPKTLVRIVVDEAEGKASVETIGEDHLD